MLAIKMNAKAASAILAFCASISGAVAGFSSDSNFNVAVYWGQNSGGGQKGLAAYCDDPNLNIIPIGFMTDLNKHTLNFANISPDQLESDIMTCQAKSKTILLSLGGETYKDGGFATPGKEVEAADRIWDKFGPANNGSDRPFGKAVVDGFDLDIESHFQNGPAFANQLRSRMDSDEKWTGKHFLLAAAPQCPFPDENNVEMLNRQVRFDMVFVQFYNNPWCGVNSFEMNAGTHSLFNMRQWEDWAKNESKNPDVKIFLGVPGAPGAAGSGYEEGEKLAAAIQHSKTFKSFGGVMVWDMSQAYKSPGFLSSITQSLGVPPSSLDTPVQLTDACNPLPPIEPVPAELLTTTLTTIPTPSQEPIVIIKPGLIAGESNNQVDDDSTEDVELQQCDNEECANEFSEEAGYIEEMTYKAEIDIQTTQTGDYHSLTTLSTRASSSPTGSPKFGSPGSAAGASFGNSMEGDKTSKIIAKKNEGGFGVTLDLTTILFVGVVVNAIFFLL